MMRLSRIPVETLCTELSGEREQLGLVVDVSEAGLRLQRPLLGSRPASASDADARIVQLEFELPGDDELVWAKGEVCFDQLWPSWPRLVRTSGVRIVAAASRHLRRLAEWVDAERKARMVEHEQDHDGGSRCSTQRTGAANRSN